MDNENKTPIKTVILLVGLPASGKSTLAKELISKRELVHIEYDDIEDDIFLLGSKFDDSNGQVKTADKADDEEENSQRRQAWNQARNEAIKKLQEILHGSSDKPDVIIMDDNYHLRGMRKEIHRLLLNHQPIRFGIIWVTTPLEICLERNHTRRRKVPDYVILRMNESFEPPTRVIWEKNYITVTETTPLDDILNFIDNCPDIIDLPEGPDLEQQAADRAKTLSSQIHAFDKLLRSFVGQIAKYDKRYARAANDARKALLQQLKESLLEIDNNVNLKEAFIDLVIPLDNDENSQSTRIEIQNILVLP